MEEEYEEDFLEKIVQMLSIRNVIQTILRYIELD
jgi:hypothetical protein